MFTGLSQEREYRVNAEHADVARFYDSGDPAYGQIREVLIGLISDAQEERE